MFKNVLIPDFSGEHSIPRTYVIKEVAINKSSFISVSGKYK